MRKNLAVGLALWALLMPAALHAGTAKLHAPPLAGRLARTPMVRAASCSRGALGNAYDKSAAAARAIPAVAAGTSRAKGPALSAPTRRAVIGGASAGLALAVPAAAQAAVDISGGGGGMSGGDFLATVFVAVFVVLLIVGKALDRRGGGYY